MIWYTFNGWSGILGGFVAYAIGTIPDPALPRWEYIFLILGSISVAFAVVLWLFFPDSPVEARFLNEDERVLAVKRVAEAKLGMKNTQFKAYQVKLALVDPKTWFLLIATIAAAIPNGVVSNLSTMIIKGMGFTTLQSTSLDAASNCVLVLSLVVAGWSVGFVLGLVMISNNVGGFTKKTFTTALVSIGYCVGNVVGPQFLIESEAPIYQTGIKAMFIGYVVKTVAHILLGLYMVWSNMTKDRKYGRLQTYEEQLKGEEAGMHDITECENKYHRYVL